MYTGPPLLWCDPQQVSSSSVALTLNVMLTNAAKVPVSVDYATSDSTAKDGVHYSGVADTLNFDPGVTVLPIVVPILSGPPAAADGTAQNIAFYLRLSNGKNVLRVLTPTTVGTIWSNPGPSNVLGASSR